ncbi:MAG: hypothetical protein QUU85_03835 [Candidatus Eisenbacteria bacterium]|nr:hypothetical protein [Candidatus Eisenbacteria bacterium]
MSSPRASASQPQPSRDASVAPLPRIAGQIGAGLAAFGTAGFAAASPISIAGAEIAAGIALLGAILAIVSGRWRYRPTPVDVPLLLFFAAEILSIPFSVHPARSLRCLKGDWFLVLFFGFSQAFRHSRDVRRAFRILLVSSSIVAGYALLQMFLGQDLLRHRPLEPLGSFFIATGFFGHHLTYGGHVLLTAALAASWWAFERPRRRQVPGRVAGILLQTAGVVASFARTALSLIHI